MPLGPADRLVTTLVFLQKRRHLGSLVRQILKLMGTDIPPQVLQPGTGLVLPHGGKVTVHAKARIGRNVTLMQNVTVGRADIWRDVHSSFGIEIRDDAVVCAGAIILAAQQVVVIGERAVIGANAVVTRSVGRNEIWAGIPARKIGTRA